MPRCAFPLTLAILLLGVHFAAAAPTRNLVPNASAESVGGTSAMPECWSVWKQHPDMVEAALDDMVAKFGQHSLKVVNHGDGAANTTISEIPCRPNTTYTLSVYVKTQDSKQVGVTIGAKDGQGTTLTWGLGGSKPVPATTDWLRVMHTVTTPDNCRSLVPHLLNHGGIVWWDACQVEVGERATDYVDSTPPSLPAATDVPAGTNLAPNPGFEEDGGWQPRATSDDSSGQADWDTVQTHGGLRSIRLSSVATTHYWESDLIPIDSQATYRLSAWLRTEKLEGRADVYLKCYGRWQLPIGRAGYDGGVYAYTDFGWGERYAIIRPEQFPTNTYCARIVCQVQGTVHAEGQAWFDDVSLVMQPCTQSLHPVQSADALAESLFRPDEPVRFEMAAHTPGLAGQTLSAHATVHDYFSREVFRQNLPFTCDDRANATVSVDLPAMKSTGHFILTVEVMNDDTLLGSEQASFGVTVFDADAWRSDEASAFGICHLKNDRMYKLARIAGMKWERGHPNPSWREVEPKQGEWNWERFQRSLDEVSPFGLNKLVILSGITHWASQGPDEFFVFFRHQANKRYMRLPKNLADFEDYVYRTVNQYKDAIRYWEIWNEADIAFWHGTDEEYIQLMQAAYRGAKRADPTCFVSMTGLAYPFPHKSRTGRLVDGRLFLEKCLRLAKNEFDIINFHSYGGIEPLQRKLQEVAALQKEFGTNKPVWVTETGMPTHLKGYTEEQQARYVVQGHALSFAGGVDRVFWHCFYDWGLDPNYHEHHFGLIHYDYSPKPAFMAYCAMTQNLAGARAQEPVTAIPGVRGVLFERDGRPVSVLWSEAGSRNVLVKLDGDSYRLADMMGNAHSHAAPSGLARLELTQNPVYLEGACVVAEIEQPLTIEPGVVLKPGEGRTVQLTIRNPADRAAAGVCAVAMPEGWQVEPSQVKISLDQGQTRAFPLKITAPDHLRCGRASLTCRLQLGTVDLDGLDAGSVSLAAPVALQPTAIDLDGDVADWQAQPAMQLSGDIDTSDENADDLGGRLWLAADEQALYVAADVRDNQVCNERRYDKPSLGDAVELFLDLRPGDALGRAEYGPGVYQFVFVPPDQTTPEATWQLKQYKPPFCSTLDLVGRRTSGGYALEGRIPWDAFGPYAPKPGQLIGVDLGVDDVDTPQARTPQVQLFWAGTADNSVNASLFGRATLPSNPTPIRSQPSAQPTNLLPNPGFEADVNGDAVFDYRDGWTPTLADWHDETGLWDWDSSVSHTGKHSLLIRGVTTHRTWESASVPVCNRTTYRASAWLRAEKLGEGSARIYVACYDEEGKWTGTVVAAGLPPGAVGWQQVEAIVPAGKLPEKTAVARVNLSLRAAPEGSAWFDDVRFHAVSQ